MGRRCSFCDTEAIKKIMLAERNSCFVILSDPSLMPGHLLVIPKRHVEKLSELTKDERTELFNTTIEFQEKILSKYSGCDISQHCRPFLPENKLKVNHVHIHIRPREFEDEFYKRCLIFENELFRDLKGEEVDKFRKMFGGNDGF